MGFEPVILALIASTLINFPETRYLQEIQTQFRCERDDAQCKRVGSHRDCRRNDSTEFHNPAFNSTAVNITYGFLICAKVRSSKRFESRTKCKR